MNWRFFTVTEKGREREKQGDRMKDRPREIRIKREKR
jgi:hypothetical protein